MPEPLTITEAAGFIRRGELTPSELLEQCLARIDKYESRVRAWVYLDRDGAREQAERLTAELKRGESRGPLHGIPIGIKDIIDVFDMPTGCGSKLWANSYARRDATVVQRLRQAGAVIMGKTVTTAFASFDPPVTRNPWNLERTPGGSSSGSAAAVACGICLGALATQTGGSITRPAAYCGVYSIKPTYGRVSVDSVLPLAPSMDHVGAMANCVRDLAILFQTIAGPDRRRGFTFRGHNPIHDTIGAIDRIIDSSTAPVFEVLGGLFAEQHGPDVRPLFAALIEQIDSKGAYLDRAVPPPAFSEVLKMHRIVMAVEAAQYHGDRLRRHADDYPLKIRSLIEEGLRYPAVAYSTSMGIKVDIEDQITRMLNGQRVFITPATTSAAPGAETTGDPAFNSPWSFTGHPTISLPYSYSIDGLPLATQLIGSPMCEDDLFTTAAWLERMIGFERRTLPL
jgi:Asp-tRNA(Asn)/Glu-tRNA(Gln) amidotransferase A subunit family amidase